MVLTLEPAGYEIIYADPPWAFETYSEHGDNVLAGRGQERHYKCMTIEDICNVPVWEISHENSALFMWTTSPHLEKAFEVIKRWYFVYKTVAFVWIKGKIKDDAIKFEIGQGYWTRANAEYCLLATRGNPKRISASVHQVIFEPSQEHSRKPSVVRDRIVELMGDLPRVELFARQKVKGWSTWGDEIESDDIFSGR